jgi:DSHCT (NUC185) domain
VNVQETARRIAKVSLEAKLQDMNEQDYVESFRPHMMDVVHAWCKGSSFAQICQMTTIFEGLNYFHSQNDLKSCSWNRIVVYVNCCKFTSRHKCECVM